MRLLERKPSGRDTLDRGFSRSRDPQICDTLAHFGVLKRSVSKIAQLGSTRRAVRSSGCSFHISYSVADLHSDLQDLLLEDAAAVV
jgi:hypothetical protein